MFRRTISRFRFALVPLLLLTTAFAALHAQDDGSNSRKPRKYKAPPPVARVEVTVLRASSGKPIVDAHVIFHPIEGDKDKGYLELKTNDEGKVVIDVLPIGDTVRMQVIAKGFQTYGQDYQVDKPEISMEVRMNRPGVQYSIYNNSGSSGDDGNKSGNSQQPPPSSGDKPDQPKPDSSQPKSN